MAAEPKTEVDHRENAPLGHMEEGEEDTSLELDDYPDTLPDAQASPPQNPPKRKGGRKPIYATVEERKQRNRQAQAAFRERRSEYIKQLEHTLKQHEELLQVAQRERQVTAYRSAAMQSRISSLERMLREQGVDIEAELKARGEHITVPQEPAILPGIFNNPSGSGVRRPLKQNGSSGSTRLDLLKAKAATAHSTLTSPLNSPESQTSIWNEPMSPSSSIITSPIANPPEASGAGMYSTDHSTLQGAHDLQRQRSGMPVSGPGQMSFPASFDLNDAHFRSRQPQSSLDAAIDPEVGHGLQSRFTGEWLGHCGITSGGAERYTKSVSSMHTDYSQASRDSQRSVHERLSPMHTITQDGRHRRSDNLTMPEGFSQEIFPLTYTSGAPQFPGEPAFSGKKGDHTHT